MDTVRKYLRQVAAPGLFVSCLLLLLLGDIHVKGQELAVDMREVHAVVDAWTEAHNDMDLPSLEQLYAEEVTFYGKRVSKTNCLNIKSKLFQAPKFVSQEIVSKPFAKVYDTEVIRTSFVKRMTSGTIVTDYDAYLLLKRIDGKLRIIGESDLTTDSTMGFVPDVGSELNTSLLSVKKARMEVSFWSSVYRVLLTLLVGVALVGLTFLLLKVRGGQR